MANAAVLSILLKAQDQVSSVLGSVGKNMDSLGSKVANNSKAIGAGMLGVGAAITGFAALSVKASLDYSASMAKVHAVTGATDEQFRSMQDAAKELGQTTQFTASQVAQAMSYMGMAGMRADTILEALPDTLNLAAAGALDMGSAANIVTNILAGFGMEADDLGRATDVLSKTFTSSNTDLMMLGESMKYAAPVAKAFGLTFEETSAIIGMFGNAGIQGSMAGSTLRQALVQLDKSAEEFGLTVYDATGKMLPMADILGQLEEKNLSASEAMELFQLRAGPGMMALLDQGSGALRQFTKDLKESGGTAENIAKVQMEGLHGELITLKSAFESVQLSVAEAIGPAVSSMAEKFTGLFRQVSKVPAPLIEVGVALGGVFTVVGTLLIALPKITTAIATMGTAWTAAGAKAVAASRAMSSVLLTPAGAGIGILTVGLGAAVFKSIDDLKKHRATMEENIMVMEQYREQYYRLGIADRAWADSLTDATDTVVYAMEKQGLWKEALEIAEGTLQTLTDAGIDNSRIMTHWANIISGLEGEVAKYEKRLDGATDATKDLADATAKAKQEMSEQWGAFVEEVKLGNDIWNQLGFKADEAFELIATLTHRSMSDLATFFADAGYKVDDWEEHWRDMVTAAGLDWTEFADLLQQLMDDSARAIDSTTEAVNRQTMAVVDAKGALMGYANVVEGINSVSSSEIHPVGWYDTTLQNLGGSLYNPHTGISFFQGNGPAVPGMGYPVGNYASGGVVPGPLGVAMPAIVHGGETIIPAGKGGGMTVNVNVGTLMGDEVSIRKLVAEIQKELRRNQTVNYGAVTL